jgi:hypothetical protein
VCVCVCVCNKRPLSFLIELFRTQAFAIVTRFYFREWPSEKGNMQPVIVVFLIYFSLIYVNYKLNLLQGFKYNIKHSRSSHIDTSKVSRKLSIEQHIFLLTLYRYSKHLTRTTVVWSFQHILVNFILFISVHTVCEIFLPECIKFTLCRWPFKGWNML